MINVRDFVIGKLEELGGTADEIAAALEQRGITGHVGDTGSCPIANYLNGGHLPPAVRCMVVHRKLLVTDGEEVVVYGGDNPTVCAAGVFAKRFDRHHYPALEC